MKTLLLTALLSAVVTTSTAFAVPQSAELKAQPVNVAHAGSPTADTERQTPVLVAENRHEFGSRYQRY